MSQKIRVAIADDHTLVRKGYIALLEEDETGEFEVVADAPNGKDLLLSLKKLSAPPDVCLLDVSMPEMNGYETLLALKEQYPGTRFLILTQLEHEHIVIRMLKAGASGYMLKSTDPEELRQAIKTIVRSPYYNNSLVNHKLISLVTKGEDYRKISLTPQEENFLKHCCSDLGYKEIAGKMGITERNAAFYRQQLFDKLGVQSRTGLALYALKLGLVPIEDM